MKGHYRVSYTGLNDLIKDEDVLLIAQKHLENGTVPMTTRGVGKSYLVSRIVAGMLYLMDKKRFIR